MIVHRINGTYPVLRLRHEMDRLCDDVLGAFSAIDPLACIGHRAFPAVNVWEDDQTLYAEAELPGLKMDDIEVYVLADELTIKGERKHNAADDATFHRRERGVGTFSRVLRLPVEVEADKVKADLRDGVLRIMLPKAQAARPRKIEVKG